MEFFNFNSRIAGNLVLAALISITSIAMAANERPMVKAIEVQYVGRKALSEERILSRISTQVGKPFSITQIDGDLKNLHNSGEIKNARFLSQDVSGGVKIILLVEPQPLYGGVSFRGNSVFTDRRLSKTIKHTSGQPIKESAVRAARNEIIELYRRKGFPEATITYDTSKPNPKGVAQVVFTIDESVPGILRKVSFVGNSSLPAEDLKKVMTQKERGVQNIIGRGGRTDAHSISNDVKAIEGLYRDRGFFKAKVEAVAKVPVDGRFNDLVFTIKEGRVYQVTGITVNGVSALSLEKDLAPYLKTKAGTAFSAEDLENDIKMITELYRSKGYVNARVTPRLE